jgi:hypothetical protein
VQTHRVSNGSSVGSSSGGDGSVSGRIESSSATSTAEHESAEHRETSVE